MDVKTTILKQKKIKVILIFFCFIVVLSCVKNRDFELTQVYNDADKVIGVQFNTTLDSDKYQVVLKNSTTPILGTFTKKQNTIIFTPVIPFTSGESYQILNNSELLTEFSIATPLDGKEPLVKHIYPSSSIVPENLLKMYFVFSEPMQEVGNILDYISIVNKNKDLEEDVFLNLESELWNKEHTILTLWLDPGRIKTDLIPNKEKGLPIRNGNSYSLTIKKELKSAKGIRMASDYVKNFEVTQRDTQKPRLDTWQLNTLKKNTRQELSISLNESLDALLLLETIAVYYNNTLIEGDISLINDERTLRFKPKQNWQSGQYRLVVSSILEDLAGNNLNRLFDSDLDVEDDSREETPHKSKLFFIE